jgi:hypothetical protein
LNGDIRHIPLDRFGDIRHIPAVPKDFLPSPAGGLSVE